MQYTLGYISFSLVLLIMMGAGGNAAESKATPRAMSILIDDQAVITGSKILLGDIAVIESPDKASVDNLEKMQICSAAGPDYSRTLHIGYIKSRIRQQGVLPESINWSGAQWVMVKTKAQYLSPEEILSHAEKYIKEQRAKSEKLGTNSREQEARAAAIQPYRMQIQPLGKIRQAVLPCGEVAVDVESISSALRKETVLLKLTIRVDGREYEKRLISFKVTILRETLVSARVLPRHKMIEEDDLILALRDTGGPKTNASVFLKKEKLVGKRIRRTIRQGTIIVEGMVEDIPIINPGDLVTIMIESPTFRITAQGRAREAGVHGQMIRVMNTSSMKEVAAEVVNEKVVRVSLLKNK